MQVAVVVNSLKTGGMERVAVNLATAFHQEGHATDLIYLKNKKQELEIDDKSLPIHLFDLKRSVFLSGIGFLWFILSKIFNVFLKKTFPLFFAYAESRVFKRKLQALELKNGRPFELIIFRGQGTFAHIWPINDPRFVFVCESVQHKLMYGKLSKKIFTLLFSNRNIVTVSNGAKDSLEKLLKFHAISAKKVIQINNPSDFIQIRKNAQKTPIEDFPIKQPYILGLGRLVPVKNFSLLINAYAYALEHYKITHNLVIVGDGKEYSSLEKQIKSLNLKSNIFLVGQKSNPFPWYHHADLFVLSSKSEGLGMVLLESLACKTKVVSTDCKGGVRDIMNGILDDFLAKETPESLAERIAFALNYQWDNSFDHFIEAHLNQFTGSKITQKYQDAFYQ